MEATKDVVIANLEIAVDLEQQADATAMRELSSLELSLVGGGSIAASFL